MPKQRRSRGNCSTATAKQTGRGRSTSGAVPSQPLTNSVLSVNYTAMPTETLRLMLSQRHLSQTGSRLALIARLQESDSPGNISATSAPPVSDQLSAMIASIVDARLAILHPRSESEPDSVRALPNTESFVPVPTDQVLEPTPPPTQLFNGGVTVIWISPCFGYPHTQIPSEMGIPGRDTQNTDSYTDKRLEEARSFCRLSPLFNTGVFVIDFGVMSEI